MTADPRLIVALDVPSVDDARRAVDRLGDVVSFFKVGHQLAYSRGGMDFAAELARERDVFLDLKLLDIDNTVRSGVASVAAMGVRMLTVHAYPAAMRAAAEAAPADLAILGVTVLTSMDDADLAEAGYAENAATLVARRARQAREAGIGGVVASAQEASTVREIVGPGIAVVTPGIRPAGADYGDQKRVVTPRNALDAGASHLVVGRPIMAADDPRAAALAIKEEMQHG